MKLLLHSGENDSFTDHGMIGFWDLKNDPAALHNFAGMDTGIHEHQFALINRMVDIAEAPNGLVKNGDGTVTVTTKTAHNLNVGENTVIYGAILSQFNENPGYITHVTQVIDSTHFKYTPNFGTSIAPGTTGGGGKTGAERHFEYKTAPATPVNGGGLPSWNPTTYGCASSIEAEAFLTDRECTSL